MISEILIAPTVAAALLVYLLDYGFGKPGEDVPNYRALLFGWSFFLARKALSRAGLWQGLARQYNEQTGNAKNKLEAAQIKQSFREIVFTQGRQLFTWQHIFGMCPVCTHFWAGLFFNLLVIIFGGKVEIIIFGLHLLYGHLLIRILKRYG